MLGNMDFVQDPRMITGRIRAADTEQQVQQRLVGRYEAVQGMVVDYALGLAILGLFRDFLTPVLVITALLVTKMIWDIARLWRFAISLNPIAALGQMANTVGACAIALLAWFSLELLGVIVPGIESFALSAALMSGAWTLGAAFNTFFMNGFLRGHSRISLEVNDA